MFGLSLNRICLAAAAIGLIGTAMSCSQRHDDSAFDLYGKKALAEPVDHVQQVTRTRNNYPTEVSYNADLTFKTEEGETVTAKHVQLDQDKLATLRAGGRVELVYLPRKPTKVRFPGWVPEPASSTASLFLVFLVGASASWFLSKRR